MPSFWKLAVAATIVVFLATETVMAPPRRGGGRAGRAWSGHRPTTAPTRRFTPPATGKRPAVAAPGKAGLPRPTGAKLREHLKLPADAIKKAPGPGALKSRFPAAGKNPVNYATGARPFTAAWYRAHPAAWHWAHPHADAWAVATWATLAGWVGVAAPPVVYEYETIYADDSSVPSDPQQVEEARELAEAGASTEVTEDADWMSLGVFALVEGDQEESNYLLQLAIDKEGTIRGSYYDAISDAGQGLSGSLDRQTQRAAWTVGTGAGVVFETSLENLTKDEAPVVLYFGNGRSRRWTLVRLGAESESRHEDKDAG